jgi:hypothetical protein
MNRRNCLASLAGIAAAAQAQQKRESAAAAQAKMGLPLEQYEPKSMLHVLETKVPRARFPVIDIHTHLSLSSSLESTVSGKEERPTFPGKPAELVQVMDRRNLRILVNLS